MSLKSGKPAHIKISHDCSGTAMLEDLLQQDVQVRVRVTGWSMRPCIHPHDLVLLKAVPVQSLRIGDMILFKSRGERLLLHRLIARRRESGGIKLLARGDARPHCDPPVHPSEVLAKVVRLEKIRAQGAAVYHMETRRWRMLNFACARVPLGRLRQGLRVVQQHVQQRNKGCCHINGKTDK